MAKNLEHSPDEDQFSKSMKETSLGIEWSLIFLSSPLTIASTIKLDHGGGIGLMRESDFILLDDDTYEL